MKALRTRLSVYMLKLNCCIPQKRKPNKQTLQQVEENETKKYLTGDFLKDFVSSVVKNCF